MNFRAKDERQFIWCAMRLCFNLMFVLENLIDHHLFLKFKIEFNQAQILLIKSCLLFDALKLHANWRKLLYICTQMNSRLILSKSLIAHWRQWHCSLLELFFLHKCLLCFVQICIWSHHDVCWLLCNRDLCHTFF